MSALVTHDVRRATCDRILHTSGAVYEFVVIEHDEGHEIVLRELGQDGFWILFLLRCVAKANERLNFRRP
jgi:hypothetical protein